MSRKYRIVEYTNPFGNKKYEIEVKLFWFYWTSPFFEGYNTEYNSYSSAEKGVEALRSLQYTVSNKTELL